MYKRDKNSVRGYLIRRQVFLEFEIGIYFFK